MRGVFGIGAEGIPSEDPIDASMGEKLGLILVSRLLIVGVVCGGPSLDPIGIVSFGAEEFSFESSFGSAIGSGVSGGVMRLPNFFIH